jgi:hypothetical protein
MMVHRYAMTSPGGFVTWEFYCADHVKAKRLARWDAKSLGEVEHPCAECSVVEQGFRVRGGGCVVDPVGAS